jgi:hypothetical protein
MREIMPKGLSPIGLFRLCLEYRAKKTRRMNWPGKTVARRDRGKNSLEAVKQ